MWRKCIRSLLNRTLSVPILLTLRPNPTCLVINAHPLLFMTKKKSSALREQTPLRYVRRYPITNKASSATALCPFPPQTWCTSSGWVSTVSRIVKKGAQVARGLRRSARRRPTQPIFRETKACAAGHTYGSTFTEISVHSTPCWGNRDGAGRNGSYCPNNRHKQRRSKTFIRTHALKRTRTSVKHGTVVPWNTIKRFCVTTCPPDHYR